MSETAATRCDLVLPAVPYRQWVLSLPCALRLPVARADELTDKPFAVTLWDIPMVLFRGASGTPTALLDRCPHRNVPLSLGRLVDAQLECGYHGWRFGADGGCRFVPSRVGDDTSDGRAEGAEGQGVADAMGYGSFETLSAKQLDLSVTRADLLIKLYEKLALSSGAVLDVAKATVQAINDAAATRARVRTRRRTGCRPGRARRTRSLRRASAQSLR